MTWTGHGLSIQHVSPPRTNSLLVPPISELSPGPDWNATEGSGFTTLPSDQTRSSAKPVLRLITPDFQHFTEHLDVGVEAFALNTDTLIGGIDRVRFRFEGEAVDIVEPRVREIVDADGVARPYWGYWARLRRPENASGPGHLYIEAIPADATMQSRVIGPFSYTMTDSLFPIDVTVNPDQIVQSGVNYHDLQTAFAYVTGTNAENARITITKGGTYEAVTNAGLAYTPAPRGRIYLEATEPVTIGFSSFTSDDGNEFDTRHPMWARGSNITFDMAHITHFEHDNRPGRAHVFEAVNFIDSAGGVWRKGARATPAIAEREAYFLECNVTGCYQPYRRALLVRGGTTTGGAGDVFPEAACVVGHVVSDWDNVPFWEERTALTVTGPSGATLALSGGNNAASRTFTAKEGGAIVGTFIVTSDDAAFTADTNYTVENVVTWLNSLMGWSAAASDTTRRANLLGVAGTKGMAFGDTDVSGGLSLVTTLDIHSDLLAYNSLGENILFDGVSAHGMQSQLFLLTRNSGFKDVMLVNIAAENGELFTGYTDYLSQLARSHSHVVIAHCTLSDQRIRFSDADYNADSYSAIMNCAVSGITSTGSFDADLTIADCVIDAGQTVPSIATGTIAAGNEISKFADSINGDFTPMGELKTTGNLRPPVVTLDQIRQERPVPSALGALL